MKGYPWMNKPLEVAKEAGIIKTVQDIKLTNESRKLVKEGIVFDAFEDESAAVFTVARSSIDMQKVTERQIFSNYIFPPLKRSYKSSVRITAWILVFSRRWLKKLYLKKIERNETRRL